MPPDSFREAAPDKIPVPRPAEWLWLFLLLGGFLVLNILTYNLYPQVWCDEMWFSEPAVNYVKEGVFHSRKFMFLPKDAFPSLNCPLYLMVQIPWIAIAGNSVLAIRSFNYILMAVAVFLIWTASWRFGLVRTPSARLFLVALLHLGYGMSYAYRCSRPDILGMTCLALLFLSFSISNRRWRTAGLFVFSAGTVWIGLQVALFVAFAAFVAMIIPRLVRLWEFVLVSFGLACGAASLAVFLWWKGALAWFVPLILGQLGKHYTYGTPTLGARLGRVFNAVAVSYVDEFTTDILIAGLVLCLLLGWKKLSARTRALNLYCLILAFGLPVLFEIAGHWAFYYSYLRFVPVALVFFTTVGELLGSGGNKVPQPLVKIIWGAALLCAMAVGLPLRLMLTASFCHLAPRDEILRNLRAAINPGDVVMSDTGVWFETRQLTTDVYNRWCSSGLTYSFARGGHDFSPEEKRAISVLVMRPKDAESFTNYFGGQWTAAGPPFGDTQDFGPAVRIPVVGRRFASYSLQPQNERYLLQIFRRTPATEDLLER